MAQLDSTTIYGELKVKGGINEGGQLLGDKYLTSAEYKANEGGGLLRNNDAGSTPPELPNQNDADLLIGKPGSDYALKAETNTLINDAKIAVTSAAATTAAADATAKVAGLKTALETKISDVTTDLNTRVKTNVPVNAKFTDTIATKTSIGLSSVDNVKQMPIAGGVFTGVAKAMPGNDFLNAQLRNVTFSTVNPKNEEGQDGDIWFVYSDPGVL